MFKIYSKEQCTYCHEAKGLLKSLGIPFVDTDIEHDPERSLESYREWMDTLGTRTVPIILHGESYVGGFTELQDYLVEGGFV